MKGKDFCWRDPFCFSNKLILCFVRPWSVSQSPDDLRHQSQNEIIDFCSNPVSWRTVYEHQADVMFHVADLRELKKPQNWNLPHFTSDAGGLSRGVGGGKEPAEGECGHQPLTARLSCCLESWTGEIIIWMCLLSHTYGTRKSLTWEKVPSASTYISYLAQKTEEEPTELSWMEWDSGDTWYLLLTIICTTTVTCYLPVSHAFWCYNFWGLISVVTIRIKNST